MRKLEQQKKSTITVIDRLWWWSHFLNAVTTWMGLELDLGRDRANNCKDNLKKRFCKQFSLSISQQETGMTNIFDNIYNFLGGS